MKKVIAASIATATMGLGTIAAAVVPIPTPNGTISATKCLTSEGLVQMQIPDELYTRLGEPGGAALNPTTTDPKTGEIVRCDVSYQYQVRPEPIVVTSNATSSVVYKTNYDEDARWRENFKDDDTSTLFKILTPKARAAIAFDTTAIGNTSSANSLTIAVSGAASSNNATAVGVLSSDGDNVTSVTDNGVALTQVNKAQPLGALTIYAYQGTGQSGTRNVVINKSTSAGVLYGEIITYTGVNQTGQPDAQASQTATAASITPTITTVTNNDWVVCITYFDNQIAAPTGSGCTRRLGDATRSYFSMGDTNGGKSPAGAYAIGFSSTNGSQAGGVLTFGFKEVQAAAKILLPVGDY